MQPQWHYTLTRYYKIISDQNNNIVTILINIAQAMKMADVNAVFIREKEKQARNTQQHDHSKGCNWCDLGHTHLFCHANLLFIACPKAIAKGRGEVRVIYQWPCVAWLYGFHRAEQPNHVCSRDVPNKSHQPSL